MIGEDGNYNDIPPKFVIATISEESENPSGGGGGWSGGTGNLGRPRDKTCPIWPFTDADTHAWYHDGVHYCIENGLMNGYGNNMFGPGDTLSRAMLVQILCNREGMPRVAGSSPFTDVAAGAWYADAVIWVEAS